MSEQIIAYCGLLCNECPVFMATINKDDQVQVELAKEYSNEKCHFEPEDISCSGCYEVDLANSKMCSNCKIRACGAEKVVENCARCNEYPCELLKEYFSDDTPERKRLDQIRGSVSA